MHQPLSIYTINKTLIFATFHDTFSSIVDFNTDFFARADYELPSEDTKMSIVLISVSQTVHYDVRSGAHVLDVINLNVMDNRTVEIIDTRGRPLYEDLLHVHTSYCTLETGMPGGTFNAFVHEM